MDAAELVRDARRRGGLTLRALAARAGTSHSTLAAYESGRTVPTADTLWRIVRAAGFEPEVELVHTGAPVERAARGAELVEVLHLAEAFPARHARRLTAPPFGRRP